MHCSPLLSQAAGLIESTFFASRAWGDASKIMEQRVGEFTCLMTNKEHVNYHQSMRSHWSSVTRGVSCFNSTPPQTHHIPCASCVCSSRCPLVLFSLFKNTATHKAEQRMCYEKLKSLSFTQQEGKKSTVRLSHGQSEERSAVVAWWYEYWWLLTCQCAEKMQEQLFVMSRGRKAESEAGREKRPSTFAAVNASEIESSTRENSSASLFLFLFHCADIHSFFRFSFTDTAECEFEMNWVRRAAAREKSRQGKGEREVECEK